MELHVNGEDRTFDETELTVEQLLDHLDIEGGRGVAVAVNEDVVLGSEWQTRELSDGDTVEIIRATQGG